MGGIVVFPDGAQDQPGAGELQHGPDGGDQGEANIDHQVMRKENGAEKRQIAEHGDVQLGHRRGFDPHIALSQK